MSGSDNTKGPAPARNGTETYSAIVIKSVIWGPLIGWLVVLCFAWVDDPWWPSKNDRLNTFASVLTFGLPFSYGVGGAQAAVGGFAVAEYHSRRGDVPMVFALLVGIFLSLAAMVVVRDSLINTRDPSLPVALAVVVAVNVIPALVCWHLTKRYWKQS